MLQVTRMLNNELRLKHKEGRKEGIEEGEKKGILKVEYMDFTILLIVLLLCIGIPLRNKRYKSR